MQTLHCHLSTQRVTSAATSLHTIHSLPSRKTLYHLKAYIYQGGHSNAWGMNAHADIHMYRYMHAGIIVKVIT